MFSILCLGVITVVTSSTSSFKWLRSVKVVLYSFLLFIFTLCHCDSVKCSTEVAQERNYLH